jgi:SAM-dependent methyltransferase
MTPDLVDLLRCPDCAGLLEASALTVRANRIETGNLRCVGCGRVFPVANGIPRFVPEDSYADSFGFQWNRFRKTQLDSHSGHPISSARFYSVSRWSPAELEGKRVLDIGCGAGRFTEVALAAGARVVALDYSSAVEACMANHGHDERVNVVRADVFRLPFARESFDYVYCLGVLQHTPDPRKAVLALVPPLKKGGKLAFDFYPRFLLNALWPKYWLRGFTKRLPGKRLFALVQRLVPVLLPIAKALTAVPLIGRRLRYLVPIMQYQGVFPFTAEQHREWAILDTFDMLAPQHDHPQRASTVRAWLAAADLSEIDVVREGLVVGRATK